MSRKTVLRVALTLLLLALLVPSFALAAPGAVPRISRENMNFGPDGGVQTAAPTFANCIDTLCAQARISLPPTLANGPLQPMARAQWFRATSSAFRAPFAQHLLIPHSIHAPPQSQIGSTTSPR